MSLTGCKRLSRFATALFALWLPLTVGHGAKATLLAADALSGVIPLPGKRPHLSCHGAHGEDCCCKKQVTIRAADCGCHDGESSDAPSCSDPTLPMRCDYVASPALDPSTSDDKRFVPDGRLAEPPDPPPPTRLLAI